MFHFNSNTPEIESELKDIVRLFTNEYDDNLYNVRFFADSDTFIVQINAQEFTFPRQPAAMQTGLMYRKQFVRACKNALYQALRAVFCREIAWGSLTGIRPTKLVYDMLGEGIAPDQLPAKLQERFFVTDKKARLVCDIVSNQRGYMTGDPSLVNLYIHIPFCPSRCYYCSFVTQSIDRQRPLVAPYVDRLCEEIRASADLISANGQSVYSVYIGGGTPTVLTDGQFEQVLNTVRDCGFLKTDRKTEYTCEAGRPDTLTVTKIELMKAYGVNRVSVNPQSLNPKTLSAIGRAHTVAEFFTAYESAKSAGFSVNVDLIAGLGEETLPDFVRTLEQVLAARPHNITVHTLSRKRGSLLKEQAVLKFTDGVSEMTEYAQDCFMKAGYLPYYLYRQKMMLENLENVGYCMPGFQCVNNITVMEESLSVVACGAGAISKRVLKLQNRIERYANIKDIALYLERFTERLKEKERFFGAE